MAGRVSAEDGLPIMPVGSWAISEKHERIRRYIHITSSTRKKYLPPQGRGGAAYIDLYSGPGRVVDRDSGQEHDGAALAAWRESMGTSSQFSKVIVGDLSADMTSAIGRRLADLGAPASILHGAAIDTAHAACQLAGPHGLHFALLDPFSLSALPFEVIRTLSSLKRIDFLIHFSTSDLQRNLEQSLGSEDCALDRFAPGWRSVVPRKEGQERQRRAIFEHWCSLLKNLDFYVSDNITHVKARKNQTLYYLVLASRSDLALQFWKIAEDKDPQRLLL